MTYGPDTPTEPWDPPSPWKWRPPADVIPQYGFELVERIGVGGMGEVWAVYDPQGRFGHEDAPDMAVKFLRPEFFSNPQMFDAFAKEVGQGQEFLHDNTAPTRMFLDLRQNVDAGWPPCGLLMDRHTVSLATVLKELRQSGDRSLRQAIVIRIGRHLAGGLNALHHTYRRVHRNLKPSNVLVQMPGHVQWDVTHVDALAQATFKISDFAAAWPAGCEIPFPVDDDPWKAPEVFATSGADEKRQPIPNHTANTAEDVFAFGMILRALLGVCGLPPAVLSELADKCTADDPKERRTADDDLLQRLSQDDPNTVSLCPAPIPPGTDAYSEGTVVDGKYELVQKLGEGGMARVWKAVALKTVGTCVAGTHVALKLGLSDKLTSGEEMKSARREAESLANVEHPNLVRLYDARFDTAPAYIAMQLVPSGRTLHHLVHGGGPLSPMQAAKMMAQIANAVAHLHGQRPEIYHRDLKPTNILLDKGNKPLVADCGLAVFEDRQRTDSGGGTVAYMSPEQHRGKTDISKSADVWALGAILYYTLTGRAPFEGRKKAEIIETIRSIDKPQDPRAIVPNIPDVVADLCMRCLEKDKHERPRRAEEFAETLRDWIKEQTESAPGVNAEPGTPAREFLIPTNLRLKLGSFTGRHKELNDIHRHLAHESSVALFALHHHGGVGKTELAIAYGEEAYKRGDFPGGVFMVRGDGNWDDQLALPGDSLRLPVREQDKPKHIADRVRRTLRHGARSLLIVDNVNDAQKWKDDVHAGALPGGNCRQLITTRCERLETQQTAMMYPLGRLDQEDAVELLGKFRADVEQPENRPIAIWLADWFGSMTIGLTTTGAYMRDCADVTWRECQEILRAKGSATVAAMENELEEGRPDLYEQRVNVVFGQMIEHYARKKPAHLRALQYAALLPEAQVPRFWLSQLLIDDSDIEFDENLPGGDAISAARRVVGELEEPLEFLLPVASAAARPKRPARSMTPAALEETRPATDSSTQQASTAGRPKETCETAARDPRALVALHGVWRSHLCKSFADHEQLRTSLWERIASLFERRVFECQKHEAPFKPVRSEIRPLSTLADQLSQARPDDTRLAVSYSNLALILQDQGGSDNLEAAKGHLERAIEIWKEHFGPHDARMGIWYGNLASVELEDENRERACELARRALVILKMHFPDDHPSVRGTASFIETYCTGAEE